jgi:hypothetical protein
LEILALALVAAIMADSALALAQIWAFTTDDAYISLRYARNLARGLGPVFNAGGTPVEGYSNFLQVALGALWHLSGLDPVLLTKLLGGAAFLACLPVLWLLGRLWLGPLPALLPVLLVAGHRGALWWAVSGLETPLFLLLLLAGAWLWLWGLGGGGPGPLADARGSEGLNGRLLVGGLLLGLAAITRAEGIIPVGLLLVGGMGWRRASGTWLIAALLPLFIWGTWFLWRWWFYGSLFPNSVLCKGAGGFPAWVVVIEYLSAYWYLGLLALGSLWPGRSGDGGRARSGDGAPVWLLLPPALAYFLIMARVDPILAHMDRYLLPAHALLGLAAATFLGRLPGLFKIRGNATVATLLFMVPLVLLDGRVGEADRRGLEEAAGFYQGRMELRGQVGAYLQQRLAPEQGFLVGDAGLIPYAADRPVLDALCLNSREFTAPPVSGNPDAFAAFAMQQRPTCLVVHSYSGQALKPRTEGGVFPVLVTLPGFLDYSLEKVFSRPRDDFSYWVYCLSD